MSSTEPSDDSCKVSTNSRDPSPLHHSVTKKIIDWDKVKINILHNDVSIVLQAVNELSEKTELIHTELYPETLSNTIDPFTSILSLRTSPNSNPESVENRLRRSLLDLLSRFPSNEALKPHALLLFFTVMDVLKRDYEENALIACKIILDLLKKFNSMLKDQIQPYFDFVQSLYVELPKNVNRNFMAPTPVEDRKIIGHLNLSSNRTSNSEMQENITLKEHITENDHKPMEQLKKRMILTPLKASSSFRVLSECPITVMLMMQLNPSFVEPKIPKLIPLMVDSLLITQPPPTSLMKSPYPIDQQNIQQQQQQKQDQQPLYQTNGENQVDNKNQSCTNDDKQQRQPQEGKTHQQYSQQEMNQGQNICVENKKRVQNKQSQFLESDAQGSKHNEQSFQQQHVQQEQEKEKELEQKEMQQQTLLPIDSQVHQQSQLKTVSVPQQNLSQPPKSGNQLFQQAELVKSENESQKHLPSRHQDDEVNKEPKEILSKSEMPHTHPQKEQMQTQDANDRVGQTIYRPLQDQSLAIQQKNNEQQLQIQQQNQRLYYTRLRELKTCQVKTLSSLTYLISKFSDCLKPYENQLANAVVKLLSTCPADAGNLRKELFKATQHILSIDNFRKGFKDRIDIFLDERVLFGSTPRYAEQSIIRPIGYSTVADLVHHSRSNLTNPQISRVILFFSRVVHDPFLPLKIQTSAVRSLLNLLERINSFDRNHVKSQKDLIGRIFEVVVFKFKYLKDRIALVKSTSKFNYRTNKNRERIYLGKISLMESHLQCYELNKVKENLDVGESSSTVRHERPFVLGGKPDIKDSIEDVQSILKPMIVGLKSVIWSLINVSKLYQGVRPSQSSKVQYLTQTELNLVGYYMEWGLACMDAFKVESSDEGSKEEAYQCEIFSKESESGVSSSPTEIYELFATSFTVLDSYSLHKAIGPKMSLIYNSIIEDENLITIPQYLISNREVSSAFCEILFNFVLKKIGSLSLPRNPVNSSKCDDKVFSCKGGLLVLRLFKTILQSLSMYKENEIILRPHLQTIVTICLRCATESRSSTLCKYYVVLRVLFRAINKFEKSYKELLPLLPTILNGLWRTYGLINDIPVKHIIIELCLALPARLSSLLPHIPLLLRLIIEALKTENGDLINLGLRTLQFWVENLNLEYLYPIISEDQNILTELMESLCRHLRPAPYPYGLITLRLLGKLGGKNRQFFREPISIDHNCNHASTVNIRVAWKNQYEDAEITASEKKDNTFNIPLEEALNSALSNLKMIVYAQKLDGFGTHPSSDEEYFSYNDENTEMNLYQNDTSIYPMLFQKVCLTEEEVLDLDNYSIQVVELIKKKQAKAAFTVIGQMLPSFIHFTKNDSYILVNERYDISEEIIDLSKLSNDTSERNEDVYMKKNDREREKNSNLKKICIGLMYAMLHDDLYEDAWVLIKGLSTHFLLLCVSHSENIHRVDSSGNIINETEIPCTSKNTAESGNTSNDDKVVKEKENKRIFVGENGRLQPMASFGSFIFSGKLAGTTDPFAFNESFVQFIIEKKCPSSSLDLISHLAQTRCKLEKNTISGKSPPGCTFFFENLLFNLCDSCFAVPCESRLHCHKAILVLCSAMGWQWSRQYEVQIFHVALFSLKDASREICYHGVESIIFLLQMMAHFNGCPKTWKDSSSILVDVLSTPLDDNSNEYLDNFSSSTFRFSTLIYNAPEVELPSSQLAPADEIIKMFVSELISPSHTVRFAIRHCLRQFCECLSNKGSYSMDKLLSNCKPLIKRLLLSRSIKNLPLSDQVAIVESLSFIIQEAPSLIPLTEQSFLEIIFDLLKMSAIADKVMPEKKTENSSKEMYIDKDGYVAGFTDDVGVKKTQSSPLTHVSSLFLKRNIIIDQVATGGNGNVCVPGEGPLSVQFRVSSLVLFRAIIHRHHEDFFKQPSSTPIGNIRPYVISLLFRSLTSRSSDAVACSFSALREVPFLDPNNSSNPNLPKDLVHTFIKPVLVDLRDYKKLTIPLLRGLSKLLSLLSDWFNNSLGEKLLEHLSKWTEPDKIIDLQIFREGTEPMIAAAIIDVFHKLPFTPRVSTTGAEPDGRRKDFVLELVQKTIHLESVLPFFRVSSTTYSPYRLPLARYLNQRYDIAANFFLHPDRLLNSRFSDLLYDILSRHESEKLREYIMSSDCRVRFLNICFEKPLLIIQAEKSLKTKMEKKEMFALHGIGEASPSSQEKRDIFMKLNSDKSNNEKKKVEPMSAKSIELQYQGLRIIDVLVQMDSSNMDHAIWSDVVIRYRWLWRAKGRHLRFLHEHLFPSRYKEESKYIAEFLMKYVEANPSDIDILFDLLRIFPSPSTTDYSYVNHFLERMVTIVLNREQQKKVLMRAIDVMVSEGTPEETKILSIALLVLPILCMQTDDRSERSCSSLELTPTNGSWITILSRTDQEFLGFMTDNDEHQKKSVQAQGDCVVDEGFVRRFMKDVISALPMRKYTDRVQIELLKISTILIEKYSNNMVEFRKELIKFAWNHLKLEDASTSKQWAFVCVSRFIHTFETPPKIILQVYLALLRAIQPEPRDFVQASLDILVPVLPFRLPKNDFESALKWTKRIGFEENQSISQQLHVWVTISRHPHVFFFFKRELVPLIINSVGRFCFSSTCTNEMQLLSLEIVGIVLSWEEHSVSSIFDEKKRPGSSQTNPSKKIKTESGIFSKTNKESKDFVCVELNEKSSFTLDVDSRKKLANYFISLSFASLEPNAEQSRLRNLTLQLFEKAMKKWGNSAENISLSISKSLFMDRSSKSGLDKNFQPNTKYKPNEARENEKSCDTQTNEFSFFKLRLDLVNIILNATPGSSFIRTNEKELSLLVEEGFMVAVRFSDNSLKQKLKAFVCSLFSKCNLQVDAIKAYENIKVSVELCFINITNINDHNEGENGDVKGIDIPSESVVNKKVEEDGCVTQYHSQNVHFVVNLIETIDKMNKNNKSFVEHFNSMLLTLGEQLTQLCVSKRAYDAPTSEHTQFLATPTMTIMEEAFDEKCCFMKFAGFNKCIDENTANNGEKSEVKSSLRALISCMRLLSRSTIPYSLTEKRKLFFILISTILDKSDNIQLLLTTIGILGNWMLKTGGPLSATEKSYYLQKMTDIRCASETSSQAIIDIVGELIISMDKKNKLGRREEKLDSTNFLSQDPSILLSKKKSNSITNFNRALSACLLTPNDDLRYKLCNLSLIGEVKFLELDNKELLKNCNSLVDESFDSITYPIRTLLNLLHGNWEGLRDKFWIVTFVEVLISICKTSSNVEFGGDGAKLYLGESNTEESTSVQTNANQTVIKLDNFEDIVEFYNVIKSEQKGIDEGNANILTSLRNLIHTDLNLCESLFSTFLGDVWSRISDNALRTRCIDAIKTILSIPYHERFLKVSLPLVSTRKRMHLRRSNSHYVNVLKSWMKCIRTLCPLPYMDTDLLTSVACDYNCWQEVIEILETQYHAFKGTSDLFALRDNTLVSLHKCYKSIGEHNLNLALMMYSSSVPEVRKAVSFELYDELEDALSHYTALIERTGDEAMSDFKPSEIEMTFWEERWIEINKELCQWAVLDSYANDVGAMNLIVEGAWKSRNWPKLQHLRQAPSIVADLEKGDPQIKMNDIFLAISTGKLNEVENLHAQAAQLCLQKWQLLPQDSFFCMTHCSLLQMFHRLVELRESGQIIVETLRHSKSRTIPDLKNIISSWRDRLPNEHESLRVWEDLFLWRNHVFSAINDNYQWAEAGTRATLQDRPWTSIRMAKTARKQGTKEVALMSLNMLMDCSMDVSDAFLRLREQIIGYDSAHNQLERRVGLNLINTTNLAFFDSSQKSELFRLKACFLSSLGIRGKANQAYCHAVRVCPHYWRAWVDWGKFCSDLADRCKNDRNADSSPNRQKKVQQYYAQAMGCFLQAVTCETKKKTIIHVSRCLWMLHKDGEKPGVLCQTLKDRGSTVPEYVWLPWLPQLITSLSRVESEAVKAILLGICLRYPQAIYHSLRAFYLERRSTSGTSNQEGRSSGFKCAESLMSELKRNFPTLWKNLESILEEFQLRFRPSYEEELLGPIKALLQRAVEYGDGSCTFVSNFNKTISKVASKLFRLPVSSNLSGSSIIDDRNRKSREFNRLYKVAFEKDFFIGDDEKSASLTLPMIIEKLENWKIILDRKVSSTLATYSMSQISGHLSIITYQAPDLWCGSCDTPRREIETRCNFSTHTSISPLSLSVSEALETAQAVASSIKASFTSEGTGGNFGGGSEAIEIPGQYPPNSTKDLKPSTELHLKLFRFSPKVEVIWISHGQHLARRIGMIGNDGKTYLFLLQFPVSHMARIDERTAQLHLILHDLLKCGPLALRRNLNVQTNAVIPVAPRIRMTQDDYAYTSLEKISRLQCVQIGTTYDDPVKYFQGEVGARMKKVENMIEDNEIQTKRAIYSEICARLVPSDVIFRYIYTIFNNAEKLFTFRKAFCGQLAANCVLQYVFNALDRTPGYFLFSKRDGRILSPDFKLAYNNQGLLETKSIPFRMTRNLETLIGKNMMDGYVIPGIASVASSLYDFKLELEPSFNLLLRDDIISWYTSKSMVKSDAETQELERQFLQRVDKNVSLVFERLEECVPSSKIKGHFNNKKSDEVIDVKVRELIEKATSEDLLCMAPLSFHAWL